MRERKKERNRERRDEREERERNEREEIRALTDYSELNFIEGKMPKEAKSVYQ